MVETVQQYWPKGRSCACKRRSVRPLQQHFNRLALWVFKKKIIWKLGAILYKTILIKKKTKKKKHYIYLQTHAHTQSLHSLSQTRHITSDHNHCCLHCSDGPASFSVECQSTWGPTGKQTNKKKTEKTSPVSFHTSTICLYKKIVFCTWAGLRHANFNFKQE